MKERKQKLGDKNIIGKQVTKLRQERLMTQKELMIQMQLCNVDINYSSLSKLEGQTRFAIDKEILAIATIFKIDMNELFKNN